MGGEAVLSVVDLGLRLVVPLEKASDPFLQGADARGEVGPDHAVSLPTDLGVEAASHLQQTSDFASETRQNQRPRALYTAYSLARAVREVDAEHVIQRIEVEMVERPFRRHQERSIAQRIELCGTHG